MANRTDAQHYRPAGYQEVFDQKPALVIFDLDGTLWEGRLYATEPSYRRVGDETVAGSDGKRIRLHPPAMRIVHECANQKIPVALNSNNDAQRGDQVLELLGIRHLFAAIRVNWDDKGQNAISLLDELGLNAGDLQPGAVVFFDDDPANLASVKDSLGVGARVYLPGWG